MMPIRLHIDSIYIWVSVIVTLLSTAVSIAGVRSTALDTCRCVYVVDVSFRSKEPLFERICLFCGTSLLKRKKDFKNNLSDDIIIKTNNVLGTN